MRGRQASLTFILITLFVDMFGVGLVYPILPSLIEGFVGNDVAGASYIYGALAAVYALMQFVAAPILGALSDQYGRRPIILLALVGLGIDYLILAAAPGLWWFVAGRIIAGIMGATYTAAGAYIADISPPEKRAQNFGLIGAAFGFGFIAGPLVGGLLGAVSLRLPFLLAAGLALANFLFGLLVLPESLPLERRRQFKLTQANPIGAVKSLARYPLLGAFLGIFVVVTLAARVAESIWVLYTAYRYGWGTAETGLSLAAVGVLHAIAQGGLVRIVIGRLGERRAIVFGLLISAVTSFLFAFASQGWMVYAILVIEALGWTIGAPALQGLMSRAVPPDEQGLLQGALGSVNSATSIIGPLVWTGLFAFFISANSPVQLPGISFLVGGVIFVVALLLAMRAFARPASAEGASA